MLAELKSFVLLAESGSVQAVARRLPLTQPAVTRQLQRLESLLDTALLDRRAKPARLTPAGLALLPQARRLLADLEAMKSAASGGGEPRGVLRLGVAHALAEPSLADSLQALRTRYPGVRLQLSSAWTPELTARVGRGEIDAALVYAAGGDARRASGEVLAKDDLVVLVPSSSRVRPRAALEEVNELGWVLSPDAACGSRAALAAELGRRGRALNLAAEVHDIGLQLQLVARGLGAALVPRRKAAGARTGVRRVSPAGIALGMTVSLLRSPFLGKLDKAADELAEAFRRRMAPRR